VFASPSVGKVIVAHKAEEPLLTDMKPGEIKKAIVRMKTELELAAFTGKPHAVV